MKADAQFVSGFFLLENGDLIRIKDNVVFKTDNNERLNAEVHPDPTDPYRKGPVYGTNAIYWNGELVSVKDVQFPAGWFVQEDEELLHVTQQIIDDGRIYPTDNADNCGTPYCNVVFDGQNRRLRRAPRDVYEDNRIFAQYRKNQQA